MVADFVSNHIGLGKLAGCLETLLQFAVEGEVNVYLLVTRAVKRPHRRLPGTAGSWRNAGKQYQFGFLILTTIGAEHFVPGIFGRGQHLGDETRHLVVGRWLVRGRSTLLNGRHTAAATQHAKYRHRIDTEKVAGDQCNGDGTDAHPATAEAQTTAPATAAAPVFEVVTFAFVVHAHGGYP